MTKWPILFLLTSAAWAQFPAPEPPLPSPEIQYGHYAMMFASATKGELGMMPLVDRQGKLVYVPISTVAETINAGASPVYFADIVTLIRQLSEENARLKTENERLWKLADNRPGAVAPIIVQQTPVSQYDPNVERQQMRMMLLRSFLTPRSSTVNVNVSDCSRYPANCVNR